MYCTEADQRDFSLNLEGKMNSADSQILKMIFLQTSQHITGSMKALTGALVEAYTGVK
jgi:hypothetical protein